MWKIIYLDIDSLIDCRIGSFIGILSVVLIIYKNVNYWFVHSLEKNLYCLKINTGIMYRAIQAIFVV